MVNLLISIMVKVQRGMLCREKNLVIKSHHRLFYSAEDPYDDAYLSED